MPRILNVGGTLGSGKSSLAGNLSRVLGWPLVSELDKSSGYLNDLFADPNRWAFEVQMAFLGTKALSIMRMQQRGVNCIIDRSIQEDIEIFAKLFYERGELKERAFVTYSNYAELVTAQLPPPDALVYCCAPLEVTSERVRKRGRKDHKHLPKGHLAALNRLYEEWLPTYVRSPIFEIDTAKHDVRKLSIAKKVVSDINDGLAWLAEKRSAQGNLFADSNAPEPRLQVSRIREYQAEHIPAAGISRNTSAEFVYIAAPFTSMVAENDAGDQSVMSFARQPTVVSEHREVLLAIEKALKGRGLNAFLPHRDVSAWGKRAIDPGQVAQECLEAVAASSLIVAIPGRSYGCHVELGVALARNIPTILVSIRDIPAEFFTHALALSGYVDYVAIDGLSELPRFIRSKGFERSFASANELSVYARLNGKRGR